jgi:ABC-type multidrug transport system fused ATPase/permease subunit
MFSATFGSILGAIILISILLPWFLVAVFFILLLYGYAAFFYRASARELKRLGITFILSHVVQIYSCTVFRSDAILRSSLYSHFSESLSGLATIRAYGESDRFRLENEERVDIENR